jgi:hypothetical protein
MITSPTLAHLAAGRTTAKKVIMGLSVEAVDQPSVGGEHDRVESGGPVGHPSRKTSWAVVARSPT